MDCNDPIKVRNEKLAAKVIHNLEKRRFESYYCATRKEIVDKLIILIPEKDVIGYGGSLTLKELNLIDILHEKGYKIIDRDKAKDADERAKLQHEALLADTFLMSSNAISEDGELVNIDRTGNRVAALAYGPKQVIIIASIDKVVKTQADAISRARNIAAPINVQRFADFKTPCYMNGACADCTSVDCICSHIAITRMSYPARRIKVILVGEKLGY